MVKEALMREVAETVGREVSLFKQLADELEVGAQIMYEFIVDTVRDTCRVPLRSEVVAVGEYVGLNFNRAQLAEQRMQIQYWDFLKAIPYQFSQHTLQVKGPRDVTVN